MTTTPAPNGLGQISGNVLFYKQPEPLNVEQHKGLGVKRMDGPFGFAKEGHAIPLTVGEFPLAAVTGPIIFVGEEKLPIAVMGLNPGDNMFVRPDGLFEPGLITPLTCMDLTAIASRCAGADLRLLQDYGGNPLFG